MNVRPFDEAKMHVYSMSAAFGNVYYDGAYAGAVIKIGGLYRGTVQVVEHHAVSLEFCGEAESFDAAAKLVAQGFCAVRANGAPQR